MSTIVTRGKREREVNETDRVIVRDVPSTETSAIEVLFGLWEPDATRPAVRAQNTVPASMLIARATYAPNSLSALIRHTCEEAVLGLSGQGAVIDEHGGRYPLDPGQLALIRSEAWHAMGAGPAGLTVLFWFPVGEYPPTEHG